MRYATYEQASCPCMQVTSLLPYGISGIAILLIPGFNPTGWANGRGLKTPPYWPCAINLKTGFSTTSTNFVSISAGQRHDRFKPSQPRDLTSLTEAWYIPRQFVSQLPYKLDDIHRQLCETLWCQGHLTTSVTAVTTVNSQSTASQQHIQSINKPYYPCALTY